MTFRHKLSRRLAMLRDVAWAVPFLVVACEVLPDRPLVGPEAAVAQFELTPQTVSLQPDQTTQFVAVGRTASGDSAEMGVTWAVTGGSIIDSSTASRRHYARFQAGPQAGAFRVIARGTPGGQADTAAVTVVVVPVASVSVTPTSATLAAGQTVQLSATPRDAGGAPLSGRAVTWGTSNAAVATVGVASGLVTGVAAGSATITATSEGQDGTAAITVSQVPVASVTVSPASAALTVGQTAQLSAIPRDASGNALSGRVVAWTTNNAGVATVSSAGLVTGTTAGAATITATSEGRSGTSSIAVSATPPGGSVLLQEGFEDNAFGSRGWYDNTSMTTTTVEHIAGSTRSLEARFNVGATTPTWGNATRHLFTVTPTLYVSYWVKYSANWVGSGQTYHPHEFYILSSLDGDYAGPGDNYLTAYIEHSYQNGGIPRMVLQDSKSVNTRYFGGNPDPLPNNLASLTETRSTAGCNGGVESGLYGSCYANPGSLTGFYNAKTLDAAGVAFQPVPGPGYKNNWNHVEAYFAMNSVVGGVGQADGVMQYWFNGVLVIDRHDIVFRTGARPTIQFKQFAIAPYIGPGSPVSQTMWVDDLRLATAKP